MAEQELSLMTFYSGWAGYQKGLVKMIAPLTAAQLALPAAPNHWTVEQVARHIIGNRAWWFQVWMGEGGAEIAPLAHWDPADVAETGPRTAAELVAGLEATWAMIANSLARWTPADLGEIFQTPSALREEERAMFPPTTRKWMIWHTLEHEIHHGGEMSLALGTQGLHGIYGGM